MTMRKARTPALTWTGYVAMRFEGLTVQETRAQIAAREDWSGDHADDCACRTCWCGRMEARIRAAVANETRLALTTEREESA